MEFDSVLITGATGTLGRALSSHLLSNNMVNRLCLLSRGEHTQAEMRAQLGDDARCRWFIGDVRQMSRLERAMQGVDLVIHAAALKRVDTARYNVEEAIQTNVGGSLNVVEAARLAGVKRVVGISSDKAFLPRNTYGQTKALMESLFLAANENSGANGPKYAICRYGNVFCSASSVVPKWVAMIRAGAKSVPLTDARCTRYYMELREAVELVVGTAAHMKNGGELAIPELPAYRLGDIVEALGVEAQVIGLPIWEKLAEQMTDEGSSETARRLSVDFLREAIYRETGYSPQ
jgi:UDP-N-acetylglucosamine 4,6-dehydratase/5-epimerase